MRRNASKLVSIFSLLGVEESKIIICALEKTSSGGFHSFLWPAMAYFSSVLLLLLMGLLCLFSAVRKMNAGAICRWWILALLDKRGKGCPILVSGIIYFSGPLKTKASKAKAPIFHGSKLRIMAFWSESSALSYQKVQAWWWLLQPSHGWVTLLWGAAIARKYGMIFHTPWICIDVARTNILIYRIY